MSLSPQQARLWGAVGAQKRLATEDPRAMTLPARNKREANRLTLVDEHAKAMGEYPLPEKERQRRAQALLNEEMARLRATRYAGKKRR